VPQWTQEYKDVQTEVRAEIARWINERTRNNEGFTVIHYASFNGYKLLIKKLVQWGADVKATNNDQLNVMHMAA